MLVVDDAKAYDVAWQLNVQPENASALQALEARVNRWILEGASVSRLAKKVHAELRAASAAAMTDKPRQTIRDLGVLFGQAAALNTHFQSMVRRWSSGLGTHHPTTPVKRRARAIEKLFRMYRGDAGCLIDLVRASVTFNTFEEMMACLDRILNDERAVCLQIKNRFAFGYDSAASAGYGDLLCILTNCAAGTLSGCSAVQCSAVQCSAVQYAIPPPPTPSRTPFDSWCACCMLPAPRSTLADVRCAQHYIPVMTSHVVGTEI